MKSIVLLGTGNVATNLFKAITKSQNFKIIQVYNHSKTSLKNFEEVPVTTEYESIFPADIYIICVKDDHISNVSGNFNSKGALVVHTAGGKSMEILNTHDRTGVFYPLQTFSKNRDMRFEDIPLCLETKNEEDLPILENLARDIHGKIYRINSLQRNSLHVAAVFVNNFVNYLYTEGEQICMENKVPFQILLPLIKETANKVGLMSPFDAQTGPALRNDKEVINSHLEQLNAQQREIYKLLTSSIQNLHGKEL